VQSLPPRQLALPWIALVAVAAIAFAALAGSERLLTSSETAAKWLGVTIFVIAGIYQFTPGKTGACAGAARRSAR
jgi:predicted metal-binding membrane protein